jgi:hypothetical protein
MQNEPCHNNELEKVDHRFEKRAARPLPDPHIQN